MIARRLARFLAVTISTTATATHGGRSAAGAEIATTQTRPYIREPTLIAARPETIITATDWTIITTIAPRKAAQTAPRILGAPAIVTRIYHVAASGVIAMTRPRS